MLKATVIGKAVATVKHASIVGRKLLLVQPQQQDGSPEGDPLVVIDGVGAGVGERVILTSDGRSARSILDAEATPVRWSIIGIQDD